MCVEVLSSNDPGKHLPGERNLPSERRKLRSSLLSLPSASSSDHSSNHHSHHGEYQASNDAHGEEGGLRRFCGRKVRSPDFRLQS